jgi:hypothetical protein
MSARMTSAASNDARPASARSRLAGRAGRGRFLVEVPDRPCAKSGTARTACLLGDQPALPMGAGRPVRRRLVHAILASKYLLVEVRCPTLAPLASASSTGQRAYSASRGHAAPTIAQIEAVAGLSPGSGSLYPHFPSKDALLAQGVRQQIAAGEELLGFIAGPASFASLGLSERLVVIARPGRAGRTRNAT